MRVVTSRPPHSSAPDRLSQPASAEAEPVLTATWIQARASHHYEETRGFAATGEEDPAGARRVTADQVRGRRAPRRTAPTGA